MDKHSYGKSSGPHRKGWLSELKAKASFSKEGRNSQKVCSSTNGHENGLANLTTKNFNTSACLEDQFTASIDSFKRAARTIQTGASEEKSGYLGINTATSMLDKEPVMVSASQMTSTTDASQNAPTIGPSELCPISELWNQAYQDLKVKEEDLMKEYESNLLKDVGMVLGVITDTSLPVKAMKATRRDQMQRILRTKVKEAKDKEWKLRFNGMDIAFKDFAEPLLGIIGAMDNYVTSALSANPYASIAWAGISLILPLFLNPSKQAISMADGLKSISDLIVQSSMRQALYAHRYESESNSIHLKEFHAVHIGYRDTMQELYSLILKFQAMCVCYYSRSGASRLGSDLIKWDKWDSSLQDIQKQDESFRKTYELLRDTMKQEEYDALLKQHEENAKSMSSLVSDMSALKTAIEIAQSDQRTKELLKWLSSVDPSEHYRDALEKRKADTGSWLIHNHEGYTSWKRDPNSVLWLHGKAGSGKSVLCSSVIESLSESYDTDPEIAVAYFYFSFNNQKDQEKQKAQNADGLLCSLIKQIWSKRPDKPPVVEKLNDYEKKGHRPEHKVLMEALAAMICGFSSVYIIIDALDECPNERGLQKREGLLKTLRELHDKKFSNVHLMCTSRSQQDIEAAFKPLVSPTAIAIDLDSSYCTSLVETDIRLYLDQVFATGVCKSWHDLVKAEAKDVLIKKAGGMFQYVACQLDVLSSNATATSYEVQQALGNLPTGLSETYDRILQAVIPKRQKQVLSVLKWLCFSVRPLFLDELAEVFILDPESDIPFDDNQRLLNEVLVYLPNLVTKTLKWSCVKGNNEIEIRIAHFSIQEYLLSAQVREGPAMEFSITEANAHLHIAESCLAYHLHLSKGRPLTMESFDKFKLWDYAVSYWQRHLEEVPQELWPVSLKTCVAAVFAPESHSLLNLFRTKHPDKRYYYANEQWKQDFWNLVPPLYYTTSIGAFWLTKELLELHYDVNEFSWRAEYGTPLQAAAAHGHQDIVQLLLEKGANVNLQGGRYGCTLVCAAAYGYLGIVKLLLKEGADVNLLGSYYGNALFAAVVEERREVARFLFSRGADIGPRGKEWNDLLSRMKGRKGQPGLSTATILRLRKFRSDPKSFLGSISESEDEESEDEESGDEESEEAITISIREV